MVTDNASNMIKCFEMDHKSGEAEIEYLDSGSNSDDGDMSEDEPEAAIESDSDCCGSESENDEIWDTENADDNDDDYGTPDSLEFTEHFGCIAHTIQLAINDALKRDQESKTFIAYIQNIMVFFKKSVRWSDELRKVTKYDVLLMGVTRWNSTLDLIGRLTEVGL